MYACRPNDPDRKAERKIKATSEALKAVVEMPRKNQENEGGYLIRSQKENSKR